jgi:aldehyde:ferredoxin oxidoreductase
LDPLLAGPKRGHTVRRQHLEETKDLYYDMMGWDQKEGRPKRGTLADLNLDWIAELDGIAVR